MSETGTTSTHLDRLTELWNRQARTGSELTIDDSPDMWIATQLPEIAALRLYAFYHGKDCYITHPRGTDVYDFYLIKTHARGFKHLREMSDGFLLGR